MFDVTRLVTKVAWQEYLRGSGKTLDTYCAARRRVEKWLFRFKDDAQKGNVLKTLMSAVAVGTPFDSAFDQ